MFLKSKINKIYFTQQKNPEKKDEGVWNMSNGFEETTKGGGLLGRISVIILKINLKLTIVFNKCQVSLTYAQP